MDESQYEAPSLDDLNELARAVAKVAHSGQTRSSGEPYFSHAERVAGSVWEGWGETRGMIVAYLHDVVEDTVVTFSALGELFPQDVVHDVKLLTRGEDEEYAHYINRIIETGSDTVLTVKLADLADNLRDLDTSGFSDERVQRLKKRYREAFDLILHEQTARENLDPFRAAA